MPEDSILRGIIGFMEKIGVYDIVLPFLLVFTIMFAILEKTKVLGMEKVGEHEYTKKNLNSMVAFVVGFLVIASAQLVEIITTVSSQIVVLLLASILFLLLIGSFYKEGEDVALEGGWRSTFMAIMFLGIVFIFLNAIKTKEGKPWLEVILTWLSQYWTSQAVATTIFIFLVVLFMVWITKEEKQAMEEKSSD